MLDSASVSPLAPRRPGDQNTACGSSRRPYFLFGASCFAFRNLPRSARPFCLGTGGTEKSRLPCPLHLCARTNRDEGPGSTARDAPRSREVDRNRFDREEREHRGGRRGESPARSESGRTPASPPCVHAVCAPCVRDEARTPHPCPSPPITFRPGSAAPPPTVSVAIPCDRLRPGLPTTPRVATSSSSPRPVQDDSRSARTQGVNPRSESYVSP